MSSADRRQKLIEVLCQRRHDTYDNLACEFHVSRRTICRDVAVLMCSYPIETSRGYSGGVKVADGYYLNHRQVLTQEQADLLRTMRDRYTGKEREIINSILTQFAP